MSRNKHKKSNTTLIGIFTDKSAVYNLAILETLYKLGHATAWQIAKKIAEKQKPIPNRDMETRSRRIYSVIQRKSGRLNDLASKNYIMEKEGLWELASKGYIALAIKNPRILEEENKDQSIESFREVINSMPDDVANQPLGISVDRKAYKKGVGTFLDTVKNQPQVFKAIVEQTKEILKNGVDLDRIDAYTLASLLMNNKSTRTLISSLLT